MSNLKKKKVNWTRVLCLFLAILMVGGAAVLGITIILQEISATYVSFEEADYTFSSETDGDTYIAVGLMYGSNITVGFEIKAPYGFVVGSTVITDNVRSFTPLYNLDTNIAAATLDANLSKKAMTYSVTNNPSSAVIGGYHVELTYSSGTMPLSFLTGDVKSRLTDNELYPIPSSIGGINKIRLGSYSTEGDALNAANAVAPLFPDYIISVASPSQTAVSVVNPESDKILFEYDSEGTNSTIGFTAYQADKYTSYIQTPASRLYEGVMTFIPTYEETYSGVSLINLLDLESYVEGVLPYEVSNSWSREVLRTFAITARSYALANYGKWYNKYGFDVTATQSDQVYRGRNSVNDAIVEAVSSTEGLVATNGGNIIAAYYSSSVGGSTIGSQYAWTSAKDYLQTVVTPWEKYADYNNGLWTAELSPEQVCEALRTKGGYTDLSGAIASVEVETVPDNPDYVYSLVFTDTAGKSVKVSKRSVATIFSSHGVNSANYTIAQGSLQRTYNKVIDIKVVGGGTSVTPPKDNHDKEDLNITGYLTDDRVLVTDAKIIGENGLSLPSQHPVAYILTSTGLKIATSVTVATANNGEDMTPFEYDRHTIIRHEKDGNEVETDSLDTENNNIVSETPDTDAIPADTSTDVPDTAPAPYSELPVESKARTASALPAGVNEIVSTFGDISIITTVQTVNETITASSSRNFIFAGKGWGHGVGISQYGAKDLADAGVIAEDIIKIYFANTEIVHLSKIVK
ncbi:MAG: SpoIID/LytB domain-containing protein [Clostridia bacterium]|nr:SpoIID/LytB domain-containing protein [Clostridia bacterium]